MVEHLPHQEAHAGALGAGGAVERLDHRVELDGAARAGQQQRALAAAFCRRRGLHRQRRLHHPVAQPAVDLVDGGVVQPLLAAEVDGDQRLVDAGAGGQLAVAHAVQPVLRELRQRGIDEVSLRLRGVGVDRAGHGWN